MTESNRQQKSPYPNRPGTGSVPVLFSLRNVQPNIVGGIANSSIASAPVVANPAEKVTTKAQPTTPAMAMPSAAMPKGAQTATLPATLPTFTPAPTKNNRSFNVVVGLLVVALCLLVIRNSQGSKNSSNTTIASNAVPTPSEPKATVAPPVTQPVNAETLAIAKPDSFPTLSLPKLAEPKLAEPKLPDLKPIELSSLNAPLLAPANPTLPVLDSNKAATSMVLSNDPISPLSFPETRMAMNPAAGNNNPSETRSSAPANNSAPPRSNDAMPAIMDTVSPAMTTRDLIDLRARGNLTPASNSFNGQPYPRYAPEPSIPANPISNVTSDTTAGNQGSNSLQPYQPVPKSNASSTDQPYVSREANPYAPLDNAVLSGRAYPPLPRENTTLSVPDYEQASALRQAAANANPQSLPIRQPSNSSSNSFNRYPTTSATSTPYIPIPPAQGGNPFGYPPGK